MAAADAPGTSGTNSASGAPREDFNWSNDKCIRIAYSENFPSAVQNTNVQKNIIERYLNYYLGGRPPKGLDVCDLTFAVISIMPANETTENIIWDPTHFKDDGKLFFLTPEDKLNAEVLSWANVQTDNFRSGKNDESVKDNKSDSKSFDNTHDKQKFNIPSGSEEGHEALPNVKKEFMFENSPSTNRHGSKMFKNISSDEVDNKDGGTKEKFKGKSFPNCPSNLKWFFNHSRIQPKPERLIYGPLQNAAFSASCNKLLESWDHDAQARITLKYFFGLVALILMRSTTKKYTHLVNTLSSAKFLTRIEFAANRLKYSIPHKRCFKSSYRTFYRRDKKIPVMFAKIVVGCFHIKSAPLNIFKLAILSHTSHYGFGLLGMVRNILDEGCTNINLIIEATFNDKTAASWLRLVDFLERYLVETSKELTYVWARIIDNDSFKQLNCVDNIELAVIFAVFVEKIKRSTAIWESAWVHNCQDIENLKAEGYRMYSIYQTIKEKRLLGLKKEVAERRAKTNLNADKKDEYNFNESDTIESDFIDFNDKEDIENDYDYDFRDDYSLEHDYDYDLRDDYVIEHDYDFNFDDF